MNEANDINFSNPKLTFTPGQFEATALKIKEALKEEREAE
jgi:hypothetical protein